jgi:hypothetical protein
MGSDDKSGKDEADASGTVRSRVLVHLRRLMIPGVMGLSACHGKDPPPVVGDPMPPPVDAPPITFKPGYQPPVVCDPMPAPMPSGTPVRPPSKK